jgi:hypothetical protein
MAEAMLSGEAEADVGRIRRIAERNQLDIALYEAAAALFALRSRVASRPAAAQRDDAVWQPVPRLGVAVWEVLRRAGKPLPVLALAEWADSPLAVTQHALDQLESFGLVKRLPAAGRRRTITYEVTCDHIAIAGDLQKPDEAALFKTYYERFAAHTEAVLGRGGFVELAERPDAWMHFFSEPVTLSESELRGLRRRVGALTTYL